MADSAESADHSNTRRFGVVGTFGVVNTGTLAAVQRGSFYIGSSDINQLIYQLIYPGLSKLQLHAKSAELHEMAQVIF